MLKFLVKGQKIEVLEREIIASDQIAFVTLKFVFECGWRELHKVVQFTQCEETYSLVLGTDGLSCQLPAELHQGAVKMSVFGYSTENTDALRATTVPITLNIRPSGFVGDGMDKIPPTPDLYAQLLAQFESKVSEVQGGVNGKDGVDGFSPTIKATSKSDGYALTITDAEHTETISIFNGRDGMDGKNGTDGYNGFSPTIKASGKSDGYALTITDAEHTETISILNDRDGADGQNGRDGQDGRHIELRSTGTEVQWRQIDAAGHDVTMWTYLFSLSDLKGADGKDGVTPDMSDYLTSAAVELMVQKLIYPIQLKAHTHDNKDVLDNITDDDMDMLNGLQQFENSTKYDIQTQNERIMLLENRISSLETQNPNQGITIFAAGDDIIANCGEKIYTHYNDGYRSLSGFVQDYPNFCSAENGFALSFNQNDFSWAGEVFVLFLTAVQITSASKLMLTYTSGDTSDAEIYFVPKSSKTGADLARYIYEAVQSENAISVPCKWLYSDTFITVLQSLENVTNGEYYLAFKGISDNSHPEIKAIKIL